MQNKKSETLPQLTRGGSKSRAAGAPITPRKQGPPVQQILLGFFHLFLFSLKSKKKITSAYRLPEALPSPQVYKDTAEPAAAPAAAALVLEAKADMFYTERAAATAARPAATAARPAATAARPAAKAAAAANLSDSSASF